MKGLQRLGLVALLVIAVLGSMTSPAAGQTTGRIRGRVVEASTQRPLSGAQVVVEGTQRGGLTNAAGDFLILNVPVGSHTVVVQMLGYAEVRGQVQAQLDEVAVINFSLPVAALDMDEIIVTGTPGAVSKRVIGNSIATINAAEITEKSAVNTVTELLQAQAPGVTIMPGGGTVGTGATLRIRGAGSLVAGSYPVVFVDGVRIFTGGQGNFSNAFSNNADGQVSMGFDMVNPDDIESIEVIKGPAAATLYGADAAGGVIQIITKKGRPSQQALQWSAAVEYGQTDWAVDRITNFMECTEARIARDPTRPGGFPGCQNVPVGTVLSYTGLENPDALRNGNVRNFSLSVRGGGENHSFYISADKGEEEGVFHNNFNNQLSFRSNFSFAPMERLNFSVNAGYTRSHVRYPLNDNSDAGLIFSVANYMPGQYLTPGQVEGFARRSPRESYVWDNQLKGERITVGTTVEYRPTSWFRNRMTVGIDVNDRLAEKFLPPGPAGAVFTEPLGYVGQNNPKDTYFTADYAGTITTKLRTDLMSDLSVGLQYFNRESRRTFAEGRGLGSSLIRVVSAAAERTGTESLSEQSSLGMFVQEQLGWKNRLYVTAAVRMDNNSVFGDEIKRLFYPKASVSYIISDEAFFRLPVVDQLKLRAAWGQAGSAPPPFSATRTYEAGTATLPDGTVVPAIRFGEFGNPNLKPERGEEIELGFEASLFKNRVGIDATYYKKRMKDAIMSVPVAPSTGFTGSQYQNLGETLNSGFEIALSGTPLQKRAFTWNSRLTIATHHNELVSFGFDRPPIKFGTSAPIHRHQEGYPLGGIWAYGPGRNEDGSLKRNSSGGLVRGDSVYTGPGDPTHQIGFANTFTIFSNFQVYALIDYKGGHFIYNRKDSTRCANGACEQVIGADAETIELLSASRQLNVLPWVQEADFAKLRDLSLTYSMPTAWSQRYGIRNASVTLAGHNLWLWKKSYTGPDPEVNYTGVSEFERQDAWTAPMTRRITTSIKLTF